VEATGTEPLVLVVDDDENTRVVVRWQLEAAGYAVCEASDGPTALEVVDTRAPDLMVLDLTLPGLGGLDVLRQLRSGDHADRPVIVLSGRGGETDRIVGLDLGADDYLVKPFSPGELAARVRSVLRRTSPPDRCVRLTVGALTADLGSRTVTVHDTDVALTAREYDLLLFLLQHPRQVFSREQLLDRVWNSRTEWQGDATVTEHVHRLRNKLGDGDDLPVIKTVRGVGYLLAPPQ
jgi:two-component system, OmpR family, phosphate regulon response regulator PhoB